MWQDFKKRKLGRWVLGYLAGAWIAYEVLSLVSQNFAWPPVVVRLATVVLAVGLGTVVVVAWFHGERGHQRVVATEVVLLVALLGAGVLWGRAVVADARSSGADAGPDRGSTRAPEPAEPLNSLAVVPLRNQSGDPDQDFFSDGLSEELMTVLSRVPGLRLAARTSCFAFKGRDVSADSIARTLRVRHLLDGSVSRQGDSLRISVALIDARRGYELWSASYRRPARDVFAVQQEIARAVVDVLPLDPVLLEADWSFPDFSTSVEAHDLYLLARQAWRRRTGEDLLRAVDYLEEALELDPDYAPAWAALAEVYVVLPGYTSVSSRTALDRLRASARRAIELDSLLISAHTALGYGNAWMSGDFAAGIELLDRALEMDPEYASALHWRGELLAHAGRFEESRRDFELALELDPLSGVTWADYGQALQLAGDHEEAVALLESYLVRNPGYLIAQYWLVYPSLLTGRYERAEELVRAVAAEVGLEPEGMARAVRGLAGEVPRDQALSALDSQPRSGPGISLVLLGSLYGQLGDTESGYLLLENRSDPASQLLVYLATHPVFEPYREDPRFEAYRERLRLG